MGLDAGMGIREVLPFLIGIAIGITIIAAYVYSIVWVMADAQKRGYSGAAPFLLWLVFGPLCVLIWLCFRPVDKLVERTVHDYANADDALAAASRLDMLGDWDEAIVLYQNAAARWPEHEGYANECVKAIMNKKGES